MRDGWELWDLGTGSFSKDAADFSHVPQKGKAEASWMHWREEKSFPTLKASQLLYSCLLHLLNGEAKQQETLRQL